jgi:RNA polymerase sigma-70 factor (ECF subfamily)
MTDPDPFGADKSSPDPGSATGLPERSIGERFTTTHWSVILAAGEQTSPQATAALEELCRSYWPPLYAYIRRRGYAQHDAEDLTQGFFAMLIESNLFGRADPEKGRFRSFMLVMLNHYLNDAYHRANAAKRGGGKAVVSLDDQAGESLVVPGSELSPEMEFQRNWATTVLRQALTRLQTESARTDKRGMFEALRPFLEGEAEHGDYAEVAARLGMTSNRVAVSVYRLRQRYGELVRSEIARTVTRPDEVEDEFRYLLSALAGG